MSEIFDSEYALSLLDGEKSLLKMLMEAFINDKLLDTHHLVELERQSDTTEAAKYVHYYKGAARQLGAKKMAASGQALEDVLRKKTEGNINELNKAFAQDYVETYKTIKEELSKLN